MKGWALLLSAMAILRGAALSAQDISGSWQGIFWTEASPLESQTDLHTFLQISKSSTGGLQAVYYDNAAASKRPIHVTALTFANMEVAFSIEQMHFHYTGRLSADGLSITGAWKNATGAWTSGPLDFRRVGDHRRITPEQLKQIVTGSKGLTDGRLAKELFGLEMTARLTPGQLSAYEAGLPGLKDRQALMELSDRSLFLDPSATEFTTLAIPDLEAQRKMLALSVDYVMKTFHQLPDLYATRRTTSFIGLLRGEKPMRPAGTFSATVLYENGKERLHSSLFHSPAPGLTTSGEFGPILKDALIDAAHGKLTWKHWEQGSEGPAAVYRFMVEASHSHYRVDGLLSAYEGEIAIDPLKGTILRLVFRSKLEPPNPLLSADILVEYGPVELGGKVYVCPVRSVALSRDAQTEWLNEVVFEQYHLFHASARIMTELK